MRSAPRLYRNRYGHLYFRCIVPKNIRAILPNCPREVRRSLATQDPSLARKKAQVLSFLLEALFDRVRANIMTNGNFYLALQRLVEGPNGQIQVTATIDKAKLSQELKQLGQYIDDGLTVDSGIAPLPKFGTALLSEVIDEYCQQQRQIGQWTEKTEKENRAIYKTFLELVSDKSFGSLGYEDLRDYQRCLLTLPPNRNKTPGVRTLNAKEVASKKETEKVLSRNTANKNLIRISSLFSWAMKHRHPDAST